MEQLWKALAFPGASILVMLMFQDRIIYNMGVTVLVLWQGSKCRKTNRFKTRTKSRTAKNKREHVKHRSFFHSLFCDYFTWKMLRTDPARITGLPFLIFKNNCLLIFTRSSEERVEANWPDFVKILSQSFLFGSPENIRKSFGFLIFSDGLKGKYVFNVGSGFECFRKGRSIPLSYCSNKIVSISSIFFL